MPDFEINPMTTYIADPQNVIVDAVFRPNEPSGAPQTTIRAELARLDAATKPTKDVPENADIIALNDSATSRGIKGLSWAALKAALTTQLANIFVPTASVHMFATQFVPSGYLRCDGNTIGSASSGATARANADTWPLFNVLWQASPTAGILPIQTSTGAATTRGASADADFAANKRLSLPDLRGEFIRGLDLGRGVDAGRILLSSQAAAIESHTHTGTADTGGAHTHTGSTDTAGSHSHGVSDPGHSHTVFGSTNTNGAGVVNVGTSGNNLNTSVGGALTGISIQAGGAHTHAVTIGSGGAHSHNLTIAATGGAETRPRSVALIFAIKL